MRLAHSLATVAAVSPDQFRNRSIHDVVSKLDLALPGISLTVAPSSVAQARARLGSEPMEWLFTICAEHGAHASARSHGWRGLAVRRRWHDAAGARVDGQRPVLRLLAQRPGRECLSHGARCRAHGAALALARRGGLRPVCGRRDLIRDEPVVVAAARSCAGACSGGSDPETRSSSSRSRAELASRTRACPSSGSCERSPTSGRASARRPCSLR